ncbi:hypothetical protein Tco_1577435 [Tanacetum coccineum]
MKYCDKHNQVGFLKKPAESADRRFLKRLAYQASIRNQSAGPADQAEDQPSSFEPLPSSFHPPVISATIAFEPTLIAEPTTHHTSPSPGPDNEPTEHIFEQPSPKHQPLSPRLETEVSQSQDPSHPHVPEARTMTVEDLLHLVPNLITKVDSLETELKQTKLTMEKAILKLVKKVKKLEAILKRRHVVLTDSEDEELEDQGRIFQDIDDDPLGSKGDFVTPTKHSGEAQEEEISPTTLEAAKILSKVASQKLKSVDKGKRYKRRKESKGKDISTGFEKVNTGFEKVNAGGSGVSTGSGPASLVEAIRLQSLEEEETAKQVHLDALLAKRMEEEELTEQQKQRKAQVQFEAQHYTEEDWDAIRAKLESNAELTKNVLGKELPEEDFAKKMGLEAYRIVKVVSFEEVIEEFEKLSSSKLVLENDEVVSSCGNIWKLWTIMEERKLATPEQTATGKEYSDLLMVDSLPKTGWYSTYQ